MGEVAAQPPLRDAAKHDFRPTAAARGKGVRVFVPWGLYATVAEWDFYHAGNDPTLILDDHFHLASYFVGRDTYYKNPTYPLRTVNMGEESFVAGPLEDWVRGALKFNGTNQYAVLTQAALAGAAAAGKGPQDREQASREDHVRDAGQLHARSPRPRSSCGCTASSRA